MSDLNNYSVDDEMSKYIDAFEIKQANLGMQSFTHSRRRYNPNTNRNDVLAQMENGGYIKVGDEELVSEQPSESLVANLETAAPEQPMMQENTDQSMETPGASLESAMEYADTVKRKAGNVTADDMIAAGYDENTIKAIGIGAKVERMVLSTQEIEDTLRNGGSFIEYDPTIRETGRVELSQYLMELAEDSLAEDLRAQGIRALNPEADTNATLTEDQIATLLEGERPRLENEARSLSGMFFGSPNSLGIGVGDFVTAGVMDIQEGARLFTQGRTTGGLDRSMGALLVLAGIAEATGVGMFIGKAIKKSIPAFRAGLSNVGERLNQPGEMPTVGSLGGNVGDEINKAIQLFDQAKIRREATTGRYVGGPPGLDTPQKLAALRRKVADLTQEGSPGRFWYERSGKAILDAVGGDKVEAEKIAQAIAITSSGTPVGANFDFALQAYLQNKAGQPISTGRFPQAMNKRLTDMFNGTPWEGRKTNSFYVNLMREIDPTLDQPVTVDIWMLRAFGYGTDNPTDQQYTFVENEVNRIADDLGWEPQQVQAAIWVKAKADDEGISVDRAKFDYADALEKNKMQISWESIPGSTSGHMLEMFDAPYEVQQQYHVDISKAFLDDNGNDIVAQRLGIPSPGDFEAPGYFEGKVSPGTQTELAVPKQYKGPKYGAVEPAALELVNAYAAVRGILMKQDGVGFHRPFFNPAKKDANGIQVDIGRNFSEEETAQFAQILSKLSGHGEYNPIGTTGGVRILNFDYLDFDNKEFIKLVDQALEELDLGDAEANVKYFASQNGYAGNDWSVNKNGEGYISQLGEEGRSDIQRKVRDVITELSPRIDTIDSEYQIKYGFKENSEINAEFRSGITPPTEP